MIIVANWKAYVEDVQKAKILAALAKRLARTSKTTLVLAPPAPLLGALTGGTSKVLFAAQDVSASTGGAQTGENVAQTYVSVGATYALIGHSERRARGDTNATVREKLSHALAHGLTPILCVGEEERDKEGRYLSLVREQITSALAPLTLKERRKVVVAYEPLWAINKTIDAAIGAPDLAEMTLYLRKILSELLPGKSALQATVLYGGSVAADNVRPLAASTGINGFLVGHTSVDPRAFTALVKALA